MQEDLVLKIANLMSEQTAAFSSLESLTGQLAAALVRGEPNTIETLARTGENELRRMRARLLEITTSLTTFSEVNRQDGGTQSISPETREKFERSANELIDAARLYKKTTKRAESLAVGGSSFASAMIQICGVVPTTYTAPVIKNTPAAGGTAR